MFSLHRAVGWKRVWWRMGDQCQAPFLRRDEGPADFYAGKVFEFSAFLRSYDCKNSDHPPPTRCLSSPGLSRALILKEPKTNTLSTTLPSSTFAAAYRPPQGTLGFRAGDVFLLDLWKSSPRQCSLVTLFPTPSSKVTGSGTSSGETCMPNRFRTAGSRCAW